MSNAVDAGSSEPARSIDELQFLLSLEHALIVEYLSVCCALGHDLRAEDGGPATTVGRDAATAANGLADAQMLRVARLTRAMHGAGFTPTFGRARSIRDSTAGTEISLDPPSREQLEHVLDREESIAAAVDAGYAQLASALERNGTGSSDDLLDAVRAGTTHRAAVAVLRDQLGDQPVGPLLRATGRFGSTGPSRCSRG